MWKYRSDSNSSSNIFLCINFPYNFTINELLTKKQSRICDDKYATCERKSVTDIFLSIKNYIKLFKMCTR